MRVLTSALAFGLSAEAMNPVRRVVTLLQNMAEKVAEEARQDEDLHEQFMCYCKNNKGGLQTAIEEGNAKISELENDIKAAEGAHKQVQAELKQHKTDRADAQEAIAKATALREKEAADFAAESGESKANIAALGRAIPAIEKGMGAAFLQTTAGAALSKAVDAGSANLERVDLEQVQAFMQGSSEYSGASGEIVGILKQMKETMEKALAETEADEAAALSGFNQLKGSKQKEISVASKSIEEKTARIGTSAVEVVNMKNDLKETKRTTAEDTSFAATLESDCATRGAEFEARQALRGEEKIALADTIKILNDDDSLDLFNKTAGKKEDAFIQITASSTQLKYQAYKMLREAADESHSLKLNFIALALRGKKVGMEKVTKMIDNMVELLKKEQKEDERQKDFCNEEIDKNQDKAKDLKRELNGLQTAVTEGKDVIGTLTEEIAALKAGIVDLDKSVAEATEQRKKEHELFQKEAADNSAAVQILGIAKNRLNKFYNPKLYVPPPPQELSDEDRTFQAMGGQLEATPAPGGIAGTGVTAFVQIRAHDSAAPPPPPAAMKYEKKGEQSTGVISMIDTLVNDIKKEQSEAKHEEEMAQKEYEDLQAEAAEKRSADSKAVTEKQGAKADTETEVQKNKEARKARLEEFEATTRVLSGLKNECDWLLKNFDARKDARAEESDSLSKAKAVLNGADYSFIQQKTYLRRAH